MRLETNGKGAPSPRVTVVGCHLPRLQAYRDYFGGGLSHQDKGGNRRRQWRWVVCAREEVTSFLMAVLPYLIEKRPQAELLLKWIMCGERGAAGFGRAYEVQRQLAEMKRIEYT